MAVTIFISLSIRIFFLLLNRIHLSIPSSNYLFDAPTFPALLSNVYICIYDRRIPFNSASLMVSLPLQYRAIITNWRIAFSSRDIVNREWLSFGIRSTSQYFFGPFGQQYILQLVDSSSRNLARSYCYIFFLFVLYLLLFYFIKSHVNIYLLL